jgi:hypothetical protein
MIRPKFWHSYVLALVILLAFAHNIFAKDPWVLLHRGKGTDADVYYNKETIKKIDDNIMEVYDSGVTPKGKTLRQIRIDCANKKFAIGESDIYIGNNKVQSFDFSKKGWVWLDPSNNVERKLINAVCKNTKADTKERKVVSTEHKASTSERKIVSIALTNEYRQEGWDQLSFEATGKDYKTMKVVQKNIKQNKPLTDGQLITGLGAILTPATVIRLKKAGFEKGVFIDGHSRSYPFEISRKYYDKMQKSFGGQ